MIPVVPMQIVNLEEEVLFVNVDQVFYHIYRTLPHFNTLYRTYILGYIGDPFVNCQLEPCSTDPCGTNAECESQGRSAICKCPKGT